MSAVPSAAARPLLKLELLHLPRLVQADGRVAALNEKDAALLALVVLEAPVSRQRVAALLWPGDEAGGGKAANNLRQRLYRLVRWAGAELVQQGPTLALAAGVEHDLRIDEAQLLHDALAAQGELLGSHTYDDGSELALWVHTARQRWRAARADAIAGVAARLDGEGRLVEAVRLVTRLVAEEPLSEHASRLLMRLHHRRGDRGAALAEFERCKQQLYEQLGDAPSDETIELVRSIGHADAAPVARRLVLPLALRHPPRTVGRDALLQRAEHRWAGSGVVLLLGAAGIGKSRLAAELQRRWEIGLQVHCRPESLASNFGLLGQLATALAPAVREQLLPEQQPWLAWLADPFHRDTPAPAVQPGKVAQVWSEILRAATAAGVQALAIEDLHYADDASLQVLCASLAAPARGGGLRWLLSCRDNELPRPLGAWLDAQPLDADPALRLEPLDVAATEEFLASIGLAGTAGSGVAAAALHAHCGGHPLFMLQVLRQLQLAGELDHGQWPGQLPLPDDAMHAASQRLTRADTATQQMAYLAALCGPDFSASLMCRLTGRSAVELLAPWRRLEDLHIFGAQGFAHDLVREAVLAVVPKALAPLLHLEIARALQDLGADPLRRALHWEAGGQPKRAAEAFAAAAQVAQSCGLTGEAIGWLQRARHQLRLAGERAAAFDTDWQCGHLMLVASSTQQAAELAARLMGEAQSPREQAMAAELLARVKVEQQDETALGDARDARTLAETLDDAGLLARCRLRLAEALALHAEHEAALAELDAVTPASAALDAEQRFTLAGDRASVLASLGRRVEAVGVQRQFLDQSLAQRQYMHASFAAGFCATHQAYLCHVHESVVLAEQSLMLARQSGAEHGSVLIDEMGLAGNLGDLGRFTEALEVGERVIAGLRDNGPAVWAHNAANDRAVILMRLGRVDLALQLLQTPISEAPLWVRAARQLVLGRVRQWQGRDASALVLEAAAMFDAVGPQLHAYARHKVGLVAARVRGPQAALDAAVATAAWCAAHQHEAFERVARQAQIEALGELGRVDEAAAVARELARRPGITREAFGFYLPQLLLVMGDALHAAGDPRDAEPLHQAAVAWIEDCCLRHVPPLFRDSFMTRNPVNQRLLGRAAVTSR